MQMWGEIHSVTYICLAPAIPVKNHASRMLNMNTPKPSVAEPESIRLNGLEAAIDTIDAETISENSDGQTEQTDSRMTVITKISSHHSNERPS